MKSLIFSDIHANNFKEFSTFAGTVNSRLLDQLIVLEEIYQSAKEYNVDEVKFLGDLMHLKNNLDSQVIKLVMRKIISLAEEFKLIMIPGNHDYRLWTSEPVILELIHEYSQKGKVIREPGWYDNIYIEPYTRKVQEQTERLKNLQVTNDNAIFLGHQDIVGVKYYGFLVTEGLDATILKDKFKWSFVGHCHEPFQIRERVISVGAPLQHSFNDAGGERDWWILDGDKLEFIVNRFSPKFFDITVDEDETILSKVKPDVDHLLADLEKDFFRVNVIGIQPPKDLDLLRWRRVSYAPKSSKKIRTELKFSDSYESIIEKYVDARCGSLDKTKLVEIGRKYL